MSKHCRKSICILFLALFLLGLPIVFVSCRPATWLPDSTGFVFVDGDEAVLFDLKTMKQKPIAKLRSTTAKIAVMPGGDKIAVSQFRYLGKSRKADFQVVVYDLEGKPVHSSPTHRFDLKKQILKLEKEDILGIEDFDAADYELPHQSMFAARQHIVHFVNAFEIAIVYDFSKETYQLVPNTTEFLIENSTFQNWSPIIANDTGFLAIEPEKHASGLMLVSWDGKRRFFEPSEGFKAAFKGVGTFSNDENLCFITRWENGQIVNRFHQGLIRIDPTRLKISYTEDRRTKELVEKARKNGSWLLELKTGEIWECNDKEIRLKRPGHDSKVILKNMHWGDFTISVSPDEKKILLLTPTKTANRYRVFDSQGSVIADFQIEKKEK